MKKILALVVALMLALTCIAALAEDYTIYLITMDLFDRHWVSVDEGAQDAVKEAEEEYGISIKYVWNAPTQGKDDAAQIETMNGAFADNADVILLASNGPDTQVATIEQMAADGVTFIYVDSPANWPGALQTLATDNTEAGRLAGVEMLKELEAKGVTEGKVGIVNINAATTSTQNRETGFRAAFEGAPYEILETVYCEGDAAKAQEQANNFITEGVVGIFGANEGATVGVGSAIAENGAEIVGVGFDKSDAILQLVVDGSLLCTMAQNPYNMGYYGIKTAVDFLVNGTTEFENMDTGVSVLNAEYINENDMLG